MAEQWGSAPRGVDDPGAAVPPGVDAAVPPGVDAAVPPGVDAAVPPGPPGAGDFAELAQLRRIGVLSQRLHRAVARAVSLNDTALDAMTILEREGALPPSDLAARLQITRGAATGLIDRLEATGHAHREPDPVDGRSVRVVANPRSFEGVAGMLGPMFRDLVLATSRYSSDERAAISGFLADVEAAYLAQLRELGDDHAGGDAGGRPEAARGAEAPTPDPSGREATAGAPGDDRRGR